MPDCTSTWKPLQHPQHQFFALLAKLVQPLGQVMAHLTAENAASGLIVTVAESAGYAQDLKLVEQPRVLEHAVRTCSVVGCAPASAKACAVSTSQFVPGARRIKARGFIVPFQRSAVIYEVGRDTKAKPRKASDSTIGAVLARRL